MSFVSHGQKRLQILADYLEKEVKEDRFEMESWVGPAWKDDPDFSCGTSACAAGWATTIKSFRKEGLCLSGTHNGASIRYGHLKNFHALAAFFDLKDDASSHIFLDTSYRTLRARKSPIPPSGHTVEPPKVTIKEVVKRMREVISNPRLFFGYEAGRWSKAADR